jgi:hypothetical protein
MRKLGTFFVLAMLVSVFAFTANQTSPAETSEFRGEIAKIDFKAKTLTLRAKSEATQTATTGSTQTQSETKDQLHVFSFNDQTTLAALEAEETPTTLKISDLDEGDEIIVHANETGVIEKIEVVAGD